MRGSLCMAGHRMGICVGMPEDAGSVCHTVRRTRMVAGFSQYVVRLALMKVPVRTSHALTGLLSRVTAMLSSFRYSSARMLTLNVASHSRPRALEKPSNVTNRTRSFPHE